MRSRLRARRKRGLAESVEDLVEGIQVRTGKEHATLFGRVHRNIAPYLNAVDARIDQLEERLIQNDQKPIKIVTYRGYGGLKRLYLRGRVIEDLNIPAAGDDDSIWHNLLNTYKRFESDEIPGARLLVRFQETEQEVTSNEEGYFEVWLTPDTPLPTDRLWHEVEVRLLSPLIEGQPPVHATGYVLVPPPSTQFGVISDIDDTVVLTNATNLLKSARILLFGNARTRLPFEGVAAFYQALQNGSTGSKFNPLFYVSSGPWNLYDLLTEFLELQDIPLGPLMLRDWGTSNVEVLPTKHGPHKLKSIRQILDTFPSLPFILIGDSGQEDPEIYHTIVHEYPDRILAVYIRNVSGEPGRSEAILTLAKEVTAAGSTLVLADDTLAAAHHAAEKNWIPRDALDRIADEVEEDEGTPEEEAAEERPTIVIEEGDVEIKQE